MTEKAIVPGIKTTSSSGPPRRVRGYSHTHVDGVASGVALALRQVRLRSCWQVQRKASHLALPLRWAICHSTRYAPLPGHFCTQRVRIADDSHHGRDHGRILNSESPKATANTEGQMHEGETLLITGDPYRIAPQLSSHADLLARQASARLWRGPQLCSCGRDRLGCPVRPS